MTKWFRNHLKARRKDYVEAATEQWLAGKIDFSTETEMKVRAQMCAEMADLKFEDVAKFYEDVDAMTQREGLNATEAAED